eukprot:284975-Prorocentrum_minimum.AAC.4
MTRSEARRRRVDRDPAPAAEEVAEVAASTCKEKNGKVGVSPNEPLHAALMLGLLGVALVAMMSTVVHMVFMVFYSNAATVGPNVHQWNPKLDDPFEDGGGVFSGAELKKMLKT